MMRLPRGRQVKTFIISLIHGEGSLFVYFHTLGEELVRRGHRVVMLVSPRAGKRDDDSGNPAVMTWPSLVAKKPRDALFLSSLITRYRPDCIIGTFSTIAVCSLVGWLRGVPERIAWNRTTLDAIEMDTPVPRWKRSLMTARRRYVYRLCTRVLANSRAMRDENRRVYRVPDSKLDYLHPLLPDPPRSGVARSGRRLVYVGRLAPSKGLDVLFRALPGVARRFPDLEVELIGDGPSRKECEEMAEAAGLGERCRFLGAVPIATVYEEMASAAVQVSPSMYEAFGLVNVEANSVGTPVVASETGGIREIVVDGETGFLFPPGDSAALEERIVRLLEDEELRDRMGRAARKRFEDHFSLRQIPRQADFFERLVGRR